MAKPFQVHVALLALQPEALATAILVESPIPTERLQVAAALAAFEARDDQRALVALVDSVLDVAPDTEWPPKAEAHGATLRYLANDMLPWLLEGDWSKASEAGDG